MQPCPGPPAATLRVGAACPSAFVSASARIIDVMLRELTAAGATGFTTSPSGATIETVRYSPSFVGMNGSTSDFKQKYAVAYECVSGTFLPLPSCGEDSERSSVRWPSFTVRATASLTLAGDAVFVEPVHRLVSAFLELAAN